MKQIILCLVFSASIAAHAQFTKISYKETTEDFPNPERGFYVGIGTSAGKFTPLDAAALKRMFTGAQKHGSATYAVQSTLLMREYTLDIFKNQPLSQEFLDAVDHDLDAVRAAGLKLILRFAYINKTNTGDCPDIYKICPPYGDAPKDIVLGHIAQLAPLLKKHADIIAVLQEGFIGIWGENFYTDYFGDPGKNGPGRIMDSSWRDRGEVLHALLQALPPDRMVQVRTPQIKQKYVYGPNAGIDSKPLTITQAFDSSDKARIGFHNDCFLSGPDDYGTYFDYGSSTSPQRAANQPLRDYLGDDSWYVPVGGETCVDAYSPQNDCAPAGHAEAEMSKVHLSFLNTTYNNTVNNDWDSGGCISSIRRRLGYRFVLREARFAKHGIAGKAYNCFIKLYNAGYASPYNPRPIYLIFRKKDTKQEFALRIPGDARTWYPGIGRIYTLFLLPANMPAGKYDLFLSLPDRYPSLSKRPEYSIRFANEGCWEPATGYNKLNFTVIL